MDQSNPGAETPEARARALAAFFADVSPRLLADLGAAGVLAGAKPATAKREWLAVALHACVRGVVSEELASEEKADLVDAFHDAVLEATRPPARRATSPAGGSPGAARSPARGRRTHLARRYAEYDGLARTLGQRAGGDVPRAIAAACAAHVAPADAGALAETLAPLLEALAEGARAAIGGGSVTPGRTVAEDVDGVRTPALEGLGVLTARLDAAGIPWAVGGSALLASFGLVHEVNDWDVQVDADPEPLRALFADVPHTFHEHGGCHADWKLSFEREHVELIPRFAFFVPGGVVRIPFRVAGSWRGLPTASPEGWAVAYWLMGAYDEVALRAKRAARASALLGWLARHGADRAVVEELLREPLPIQLRDAVRETPAR
jgi:hypothetical protein